LSARDWKQFFDPPIAAHARCMAIQARETELNRRPSATTYRRPTCPGWHFSARNARVGAVSGPNFLAFPAVAESIVVFGAGYGWEALARAEWLHRCQLHYWGDIDTHGFAILDQLRGYFPGAVSFLMDRETLLAHRPHWGEEPDPARHDLSRLTTEEAAVYDDLRLDRHQPKLRLEQERVGYRWLCDRLARIPSGTRVAPHSGP
jgi:hypothetical protein